ncbi:MAG: type II secretion system protein [Planctomycetes bacterium]|nr:type II secretion system protein [Planctomycetota bacterium]
MHSARAFTMIELLVVISIMATIAALVLVGANALGVGSKRNKTATILETVRQALEVTAAQTGSISNPSEHPLAGSFAAQGQPRLRFVRSAAPNTALAATVNNPIGSPAERIALYGVSLAQLAAQQDRLLLPDDLYADPQVPLLFGMPRDHCAVLGTKLSNVTRFRRLPQPAVGAPAIANPDDQTLFPNATRLVSSDVGPEGNKRTIDYVLGNTNASTELAKMGALYAPPDDDPAKLHAYGRVWSEVPLTTTGQASWKPGFLNDPQRVPPNQPSWKRYRLRGLAIYDAWKVEILCSVSESGAVRLESAGKDGVFRWDPGQNFVLDTEPFAASPAIDDRDGARDNVVSNVGGR